MPKNGIHFTLFIARSESYEFYEVRGVQSMSGFLAVFVGGSLEAAMKFYRILRGESSVRVVIRYHAISNFLTPLSCVARITGERVLFSGELPSFSVYR